ncbi:hypothetical protein D3C85_1502390 [compost metagenome]
MIPAPGIIGWMQVKFNLIQIRAHLFQFGNCKSFGLFIIDIDSYFFTLCYNFNKLAIWRVNGFYFSRPGFFLMWPA